jgi:archaellum biogenesis protein FlaJ (TadC family)
MSFREKSAWVTLIAIVLVVVLYYLHGPRLFNPGGWQLQILVICFAAFIAIDVVAHIVLYLRYPKDAWTPKDEREQLIDLKAARIASWVFVAGTFLSVATLHAGVTAGGIAYLVLTAFAVSQIVKQTARIIYYRRGS